MVMRLRLVLFLCFLYRPVWAVLPLPYPIDYLEKVPQAEQETISEEEKVEEAPATEFRPLISPDFKSQKALGYEPGITFTIPEGLRERVEFWKKVYRLYSVDEYVIHDANHNSVVYRVINVGDIHGKRTSYRNIRKLLANRLNQHKREIRALLASVHKKQDNPDSMNEEEKKIYQLFSEIQEPNKFLNARFRLRSQLGQKERFAQGIIWAGRYLPMMEKIFQDEGLPMELTRLPFVESSFNIQARSKVGASGIWQFIRSTGRRYLSVNIAVDERNDPIEATRSAARLLKTNYQYLGSWPLALTAYNHGASGIQRAVRNVESKDICEIIQRYRSRTFGFASKNFYAEFLAALETELDYEKYFGKLNVEAPLTFDEVEMKGFINVQTLIDRTGVSKQVLKRYNPGLTDYVYAGRKLVPKGYRLKLPPEVKEPFVASYQDIPAQETHAEQKVFMYHRVRRGDTLTHLAGLYGTTVSEIRRANRLGRYIQAGQLLVIPK